MLLCFPLFILWKLKSWEGTLHHSAFYSNRPNTSLPFLFSVRFLCYGPSPGFRFLCAVLQGNSPLPFSLVFFFLTCVWSPIFVKNKKAKKLVLYVFLQLKCFVTFQPLFFSLLFHLSHSYNLSLFSHSSSYRSPHSFAHPRYILFIFYYNR